MFKRCLVATRGLVHPIRLSHVIAAILKRRDVIRHIPFHDARLYVLLPDNASVFYYLGYPSDEDIKLYMRLIREGDTVLDVGANIGYFSMVARERAGESGSVHGFEPNPRLVEVLTLNAKQFRNVHPHVVALTDGSTNEVVLHAYGRYYGSLSSIYGSRIRHLFPPMKQASVKCLATTIDAFVESQRLSPDFIKVDAEGAEYDVFFGAQGTLERFKPLLAFECGAWSRPEGRSLDATVQLLRRYGYRFFAVWKKRIVEVERDFHLHLNVLAVPYQDQVQRIVAILNSLI